MLFDSGTTSLLSHTRQLAQDPTDAPSQLWSEQIVKDFINESYLELYDVARQFGAGQGCKRCYSDAVVDQVFYELPDTFMKMLIVEVESSGVDLTSSSADPTVLKPLSGDVALQGYETGTYAETEYYFLHNQHLGIVAPPSVAGTNTIRVTYEGEGAELSNDADEPDLPTTYHSLICYRAAIALRETLELDTRGLREIANRKEVRFMQAMHDNIGDFDGQSYVAGLGDPDVTTRVGWHEEKS
jgi:hypothetical protein